MWIILIIAIMIAFAIYMLKPKKADNIPTMHEIDNQIKNIPGKKAVLKNVRTECEGHYGTIDTLLIHEQGIFLIYYTRTNGKSIDNRDKNKWIVSTRNGNEYIPNYINQSDYDIIFLTKALDLYKHSFKVIISLGDRESMKYPVKRVNSIRITNKRCLMQLLKQLIDENIVIYKDDKVNELMQLVVEASNQVQQKIFNMGKA